MDAFLLLARTALAVVLVAAAVAKLASLPRTRDALAAFGVPNRLLAPGALLLGAAELIVAALLVPTATAGGAGIAAGALLAVFSVAIGTAVSRGTTPDCNCFGRLHSRPVGWPALVRNGLLLLLAVAVAVGGPGESIGRLLRGVDPLVGTAAALGVALLAQTWFIFQLFRQNARLLKRIRVLEDAPRFAPGHRMIRLTPHDGVGDSHLWAQERAG